jgi:hypothetical protein
MCCSAFCLTIERFERQVGGNAVLRAGGAGSSSLDLDEIVCCPGAKLLEQRLQQRPVNGNTRIAVGRPTLAVLTILAALVLLPQRGIYRRQGACGISSFAFRTGLILS